MSPKKQPKKQSEKITGTITIQNLKMPDGNNAIRIHSVGFNNSELVGLLELAKYQVIKKTNE